MSRNTASPQAVSGMTSCFSGRLPDDQPRLAMVGAPWKEEISRSSDFINHPLHQPSHIPCA